MYTVESIHGFNAGVRLVGGAAHSAPLRHTARYCEHSEESFAISGKTERNVKKNNVICI